MASDAFQAEREGEARGSHQGNTEHRDRSLKTLTETKYIKYTGRVFRTQIIKLPAQPDGTTHAWIIIPHSSRTLVDAVKDKFNTQLGTL